MTRLIAAAFCLVAMTCCAAREWGPELKNSLDELSPAQRAEFQSLLATSGEISNHIGVVTLSAARTISSGNAAPEEIKRAANAVADAAAAQLALHDNIRAISLIIGDLVRPVEVSRRGGEIVKRIDTETREFQLLGQIGFFNEPPDTPIVDLQSYRREFAVSRSGNLLRVRTPVVADGFYAGDLTIELISGNKGKE